MQGVKARLTQSVGSINHRKGQRGREEDSVEVMRIKVKDQ
jgi:hypothetical protein